MKVAEYIYQDDRNIHVIICKASQNKKLGFGYLVQTYHFDIAQIIEQDLTQDVHNCLGCPFSYSSNSSLSGKCYTHKGMQRFGLQSMIKRLGDWKIERFNQSNFNRFLNKVKRSVNVQLVRFGAYGEPVLLGEQIISDLKALSNNHTGYTHAWRDNANLAPYLMASVHDEAERLEAKKLGFRTFRIAVKVASGEINCPASKESGKKTTCMMCNLCMGNSKKAKDIYIKQH